MSLEKQYAAAHAAIGDAETALRESRRRFWVIEGKLNEERAKARPTYPTEAIRVGIALAAAILRSGKPWGDHLGKQVESDSPVTVCTKPWRLNVHARAPHTLGNYGYRLWRFTEVEVDLIRVLIEKQGLRVVSDWTHEDGHGFIVAENTAAAPPVGDAAASTLALEGGKGDVGNQPTPEVSVAEHEVDPNPEFDDDAEQSADAARYEARYGDG